MPLEFLCPRCQKRYEVPDTYAGKGVKCDRCSAVIAIARLPGPSAAPPPPRPSGPQPAATPPPAGPQSAAFESASGLASLLDEALASPGPSRSPDASADETADRDSSAPWPYEPKRRGRGVFGRKRGRSRRPRQRKTGIPILTMIGLMLVVMPWILPRPQGERVISGPYTAGFIVGTSLLGLILICVGWLTGRR